MGASMGPTDATKAAIARLKNVKLQIKLRALSAQQDIIYQMRDVLIALYGEKLAHKWFVEPHRTSDRSTVLAQVDLDGESKYIRGFEFGTPPHEIAASAKQALAFQMGGQDVVVRRVHHPGTQGHNKRDILVTAFGEIARTEWEKAIDDALITVK